jgi:tetratricopeptide (TPR) repeat protein
MGLFFSLLFFAVRYSGMVSFDVDGDAVSVHSVVIILILGGCFYFYRLIKTAILKVFPPRSNYQKGLDNLQLAFSAMLLRDKFMIEKFLKKSEKYLGDMPIILWLKGQQSLIDGDEHRAKATFYSLCEREKDTVLGAYSLCQLATKAKADDDALAAINSILKISPHNQDLTLQAVAIAVKNKNFIEAKKHLGALKKSDKSRLIEAIIYSEEGIQNQNPDLTKRAFKLAPELSDNAIVYAEHLINKSEYRSARDVLRKSFVAAPNREVFNKYISVGKDLSHLDQIKLASNLISDVPWSWIGYYELAKLFLQEGMIQSAFQNLLVAYEKEPFDFIGNELTKVAENLEDPKPAQAIEILSQPLKLKRVNFIWKCAHCGSEEPHWESVCKFCNRIAEYERIQKEVPLLIN